jgi:hypothetical protein
LYHGFGLVDYDYVHIQGDPEAGFDQALFQTLPEKRQADRR